MGKGPRPELSAEYLASGIFHLFAVLRRCQSYRGAKRPGERTVIAETTIQCNHRNRGVAFPEPSGRRLDPCSRNILRRCDSENTLQEPGKTGGGHARFLCQNCRAPFFPALLFQLFESEGQLSGYILHRDLLLQIPGKTNQPNHRRPFLQRKLRGQAPAGPMRLEPLHFQMIDQGTTR